MAEQNQITVESLSPEPITPIQAPVEEEQQEQPPTEAPAPQPAVAQPAPAISEEQLVLPEDSSRPADPDEVLAQRPSGPLGSLPTMQDIRDVTSPYIESAVEGFKETFPQSFAAQTADAQDAAARKLPAVLPKPFIQQVQDGDIVTPEQIAESRNRMGEIYWSGILSTGEEARDNRRKEVISDSVGYGVPRLDSAGNPVVNPEYNALNPQPGTAKYIYDAVVPFTTGVADFNTRVVTLMEAVPNNTGVFHVFTKEGGLAKPKVLDTGRREMLDDFQDPISAFFFRIESEEGGLDNYRKILAKGGITNPTRQTYYMKRQAEADNPLMGIESTRTEVSFKDMAGLLANIGIGAPDVAMDFTAALPFYWYQATGQLADLFSKNKMPYANAVEIGAEAIDRITGGNVDHLYFDSAIDSFAKNAGVSIEEAEAVLTYSPDLTTTGVRMGIETITTSGPILGVSRALAAVESAKFSEWLMRTAKQAVTDDGWATGIGKEIGLTEAKDLNDAIRILEATGMDSQVALRRYIDETGGGKLGRAYLQDALDLDVQARAMLPGPFRAEFLKPKIEAAARDLTNLETQIEAAQRAGRSQKYIATLEARRRVTQNNLRSLREETVLPEKYIQFLKDEGIATGAAAVAWQAFYNPTDNEMIASLASAAGAVLSSIPTVRGGLSASVEDISNWFRTIGDPEARITSSAAIKMRRHVEGAPPEVRDSIMAFAEYRAKAIDELTKFTYPTGHPNAGQQIISDEAFDQGFWRTSGLLSFRNLRTSQLGETINVQKDAGKLSSGLAEIEKSLQQEQKLMNESAELFDQFRYVMFSEDFDPESPAGKLITTMVNFYDGNKARLTDELDVINTVVEQRKTLLNAFLTGQLEEDVMEGILVGNEAIADLLRIDKIHYDTLNLDPDARVEDKLAALDTYYSDLNKRVAEAIDRGRRGRFDRNAEVANDQFRFFIESNEQRAYQEASLKFDAIRENPEFANARIDMTDVFDMMISTGEDGVTIDSRALMNLTAMSNEGTDASRQLANLNIPQSNLNMVRYVFEDAAQEYFDNVGKVLGEDMVNRILEADEGVTGATAIDKFLSLRRYIDENKNELGDAYDLVRPKLGVDVSSFMHVVSGIGSRSGDNIMGQQLRQDLLERGRTGFFDDFYNPQATRENIEGFGEAYDEARTFYRERYIDPFRNMNKKIAQIIREPDAAVRARSFEQFMDEAGINQPVRTASEIESNLNTVIREITGGRPLDINSDEGKLVRQIFTKYVTDEISRTPGGKRFLAMLLRNSDAFTQKSPLIIPEKALELEAELQSGISSAVTTRLENLLAKTYDENGNVKYLFADDNGNPIVDPKVIDLLSFENGMLYDQRFRDAAATVARDIDSESKAILKALDDTKSQLSNEIEASKHFVERFGNYAGGAGEGFFKIAQEEDGLRKIATLKSDFVTSQVAKGVPQDVAEEAFEQMKQQRVQEYIFSQISRPGENRAFQEVVDGEVQSIVKRTSEIDPAKLMEMLGLRGDTVSKSRKEQVIRELLGDETVDHMKLLANELFTVDTKTGQINVTGISMPLSAESLLSRGTSFFRGVISLRWLISEAAIRQSRMANLELTKLMLFNPDAGKQILKMVTDGNYDVATEPEFIRVLISQIAKNDAVQQYVSNQETRTQAQTTAVQAIQSTIAQPAVASTEQPEEEVSIDQQISELIPNRTGR